MSRILVTGSNGFIGGHLVRSLRTHHEIFGLVRPGSSERIHPEVQWIEHNLTQPLGQGQLPKRVNAVVHLAQSRMYQQFPEGAEDMFTVNTQSTLRLLEYARQAGADCFIFASSGGVYGWGNGPLAENHPVNPYSFYLSSKYAAELLIGTYRSFFRTVIFRFFFVYGPGRKGMLMETLVRKVMDRETIIIEGKSGLQINPIYVEDAIRVFEPALNLSTSELFNVAGDETVTIANLVKLIGRIVGKEALVKHTDTGPQGDLVGDNRRMKEVLNVCPEVPLLEGLKEML